MSIWNDLNDIVTGQMGVKGVAVLRVVPGSQAAKAGLRSIRVERDGSYIPGDVIIAVQGKEVDSIPRLLARLDDFRVGETVSLSIMREGKQMRLSIRLQAESLRHIGDRRIHPRSANRHHHQSACLRRLQVFITNRVKLI